MTMELQAQAAKKPKPHESEAITLLSRRRAVMRLRSLMTQGRDVVELTDACMRCKSKNGVGDEAAPECGAVGFQVPSRTPDAIARTSEPTS